MGTGCFSWCRLHILWSAKKKFPQVSTRVMLRNLFDTYLRSETGKSTGERPNNNFCQEVYGAEIRWSETVGSRPVISLTSIWVQNLSENSQSVVPTKADYTMATVKEVLTLSQSAAGVTPVPFLQEAIGVALKIIQVCEVRRIPPLMVARQMTKIFIRRHRLLNKRSKSCKLGSAISWSSSWTT